MGNLYKMVMGEKLSQSIFSKVAISVIFIFFTAFASFGQDIIYSCDFEDDTENANWTFANCDYYNGWYIGTAAYNGGSKGLYISNDYGTSNLADYDDTYVYAYREINATETDQYLIVFDWKAVGATPDENSGEGYCLLRSFLVPTTLSSNLNDCDYNGMSYDNNTTPSGWIDVSSSENGLMYGQSSWQHSAKVINLDAGTYYLVFFWKNNSDNIDPPAAVDNISISKVVNPVVATSAVSNLGATFATLNGEILSQGASDVIARGFEYGTDSENLSNTLQSADNTDAFSSELTGLAPNTTYYYRAYATNSNGTGYGAVKSFKTLDTFNGHVYVDLGLESGTLWATTNVGANSPEEYGNYYAWGETSSKETYSWSNYAHCNGESNSLTKYCDDASYGYNGYTDDFYYLESTDDAATANWGTGWQMPTYDELEELNDYCTVTWTTRNGVNGRLYTGPNGNSIFLPAAGDRDNDNLESAGSVGCYWSSSRQYAYNAWYLNFYSGNSGCDYDSRHYGYSVRPILKASPTVETKSATDVEPTTATLQGKILFAEDATVTNRGFSFGTDSENLAYNFTSPDNINNFTYSFVNLTPNITYYYQAYANIDGETKYGDVKSFTTMGGQGNDYGFVDLGLPSGNKWATYNVGASSPEDFGGYYGWGETYNKEIGNWDTYIYYNGSAFTKYTSSDGLTTLEAMDDVATANWGDGWRMPTRDETNELLNNCDNVWTTRNGVYGRLYTSRINGNSIFVPAAGMVSDNGLSIGNPPTGDYWSSTRLSNSTEGACCLILNSESCSISTSGYRKYGRSVRAVYTLAPTVVTNDATNLTITSVTLNASITDNGNSEIIESGFMYGTDMDNLSEIVQSDDATSDFSVSITGLAEGTLYYYCAYATNSDATDYAGIKSFMTPQNPATLPYTCGFEDATENDNWVLENGNQTNKWYIGTVVNNGGENGLYISNNGGSSNTYSGTETRVYAYRDILVPNGTTDLALSFDWKAQGGSSKYEFLRVYWLDPAVVTVTAGNNPPTVNGVDYDNAGQPGSYGLYANCHWLSQQNTWQHEVMIIPSDQFTDMGNGDKIYRLYFHWRNINYSSQPPAAVDNVHLEQIINPIVATSSVSDISTTSATLHGSILSHGTSDITVRGFEYGTDEGNLTENTQSTDDADVFSVTITELTPNTTYYYRAYATNSEGTGYGEIKSFTTLCEDMCEISYSLADSYGDGWNGCAINVVDVATDMVLASFTMENGSSARGTLAVCNGREIRFEWVDGDYADETSYQIFDVNGDEIFSGSGVLSSPVSYTMSCSSCRMVADFTVTNITEESATISFTEQGQATSWELIVSETELDDNALDVSASTVILADPYYSATGLTSITQYYVYVRSVCSDDDKSSWKKRAFVTRFCPSENMCGISYELAADEGYGWSGGSITIVDVESEIVIATLTLNQGSSATGNIDVCDGREISINYVAGQFPDDVSYHIFDANGDVIDSYYGLDAPTTHSRLYTVSCPTCKPVKNIRATEIATESATIRWADYGTAENWELVVSEEELDDDALENNGTAVQVTDSSYTLTGLGRSRYYVYVRALCSESEKSKWRNCSFKTRQIPATLPYTCDFEDANENANWILANENQTNQWHIGLAASNGGGNGLYISNDGGTSNEYDINSASVVYAYRTIDIDEDDIYEISFDWRSNGDGDNYSAILGVFLAPVSSDFDLSGGNDLLYDFPNDWMLITEDPLAEADSWQNFSKIINIDEGNYNLIFYWVNYDGDGENPPAAIDNISINSVTPPDIRVNYPMDRSTTSADIKIHYTNLTHTENSLFFYYGTNRNNINYRVVPLYNSTNEYFYAEITNLEPDTKYYYYAEEISEFGTLLSDTLSFYTYGSFIDDRDNHQYSTIRIGNQIWMAEDLDYAGDIPQGTTETSLTEPYRYRASYCTEYWTYQYNWPAAMNLASSSNENPSGVQGVCPNGWHLPSADEWQELYDTLGGNDRDAGAQLVSGLYSDGKTIAESRYFCASGFNAIYSNGYDISYENAAFWSATASNTDEAYYHRIYSGSTDLLSGSIGKDYGFNVRCVKGSTYYVYDTLPYCGESYTFGTQTITESGDYTRVVNLGEDADSIYKLHITFFEIPVATISDFSNGCFGQNNGHATVSVEGGTAPYSYAWNTPEAQTGATLSNLAEGEYTVIVTDANGCSATSLVEITTPDEIAVSIADTACNSYEWNGTTYTETGEYTQTLHTAEGCDSVVTLRLTINHSSTGEFADLMCAGVPYTYGGETFTEAGTYTVTLANSVGCDSVVTLTLTYADNCNGVISGVITDDYTGDLIPNARVTIGNNVTYTNAEGQYSIEVLRGRKTLRVSAVEYISYSNTIDVLGDTTINIALNSSRIITSDNISLTTYPYLEQTDTITITNTGNGTLVWSSITEYEGLALVEDSTIQRRNTRSLWDSIQTFATRENAEQAVATDGFFIYTSSWMRPGEFNRYTPNGEYVETFFIENVGMIRNLSYNGNYFYGTDATNVIYKLDLDNQTLLGSIETDIPEIRHCSFNRQDGSLLAGDWNSLYRIDTTSGTSQQIRSDLANVYSSAFDNLSAGGPYLWLFSQTSQDNGPSACIRQFDISANDFTDKIHYLDDIEISDASLAGGICASEYVCEGKFVLLANVQNPSGSNTIATYEIGRTNSVARAERKSGSIAPSESESIPVRASATETGEYASTIRYRAAVMGRQSNDVIVNISAIAPECDAVQQITASTDYSAITLEWSPVELGEYESVSYLVYNTASQYPIDTLSETSATYRGLPNGEHCFYVRALSSSNYACLSEASDTVCVEIKDSPCDIPLFVEARSDGETITVSWNPPADVDHFSIYRDGENLAENLTTTNFVDTDVVAETDYCYTVVAHLESVSCNEISGETCMRILTGVCTEVPVLTADALGNLVALKWTECDGAVNYRIFRDNEFVGTTTDISYTDNVHDAGNYCYVVESDCEHRMYKLSNEECVFADAIAEWSADNISLYPNPTYGQFFIEGSQIATVRIFNAAGQLVAEIDNNDTDHIEIDCEGWNPGLYNVQMISIEGKVATRKITIFR